MNLFGTSLEKKNKGLNILYFF